MNNTLIKGLRLLEELTRRSTAVGPTELAGAVGMPKSGAHRLLHALAEEGYISRQSSGTYAASIKLWELGSAALLGFDLRRHASVVMETLMEKTGETVHLAVLDRLEVVYVHKVDSLRPIRGYTQIGGRTTAHCVATGKAMMAFRTAGWLAHAAEHLRAVTASTVAQPEAFFQQMQQVRNLGYAINRGEWRLGVNGLAAPIFDDTGAAIAAIGISGPERRLGSVRLDKLSGQIVEAAQALSTERRRAVPHALLLSVTNHWGSLY